jgi:hypothetical protein
LSLQTKERTKMITLYLFLILFSHIQLTLLKSPKFNAQNLPKTPHPNFLLFWRSYDELISTRDEFDKVFQLLPAVEKAWKEYEGNEK